MSCHRCSTNFGIFRREYGCAHCGFSFCGKCCSNKIIIPVIDMKKKQLVCKSCHEKISSGDFDKDVGTSSPPMAFKKRLEALSNKPPQSRSENTRRYSNEKDQVIATKLDQLKHQKSLGYGVTQTELEERLAKLKGIDPKIYTAPPIMVFREPNSHPTAEKAENLLKQYQEEVKIDSKRISAEEEIEARLARLKEEEPKLNTDTPVPEDLVPPTEEVDKLSFEEVESLLLKECEDIEAIAKKEVTHLKGDKYFSNEIRRIQKKNGKDEENGDDQSSTDMADKIVEKFLAEATLDEACSKADIEQKVKLSKNAEFFEEEIQAELPWCMICNEDAQLRCIECEKDLFCLRCFKECHDTFDMNNHQTVLYKPPPKQLI